MTPDQWLAVVLAGVISLLSPLAVKPLLRRLNAVDVPNERSSHARSTLRGGGLGVLGGLAAGGAVAAAQSGAQAVIVLIIVVCTVLAGLLGLVEDLRGIPVLARAALQIALGVTAAAALAVHAESTCWAIVLFAVFIAAYMNFANFMDGINGISGLHGTVVGLSFAMAGGLAAAPWLSTIGLVIAAAFAAFLPWNLTRPGLFLGDVGSYALGSSIAVTACAALLAGFEPVVVLAPLAIYLADTVATIARRASRGEPVLRAHRTHAYQRLTDTGLSHIAVSLIVSAFTAAASGAGLLVAAELLPAALAWVVVLVLCTAYLLLPRVRGHRIPPAPARPAPPIAAPVDVAPRRDFAPARWVVIGSTGFIGSAIVDELLRAGLDARGVSAPRLELDPGFSDGEAVARIAVAHPAVRALSDVLRGSDVVVNAAGLATPDAASTTALYGANALLPSVVATAAADAEVARVIHLSSAAVQGRRPVLDESVETKPFSPYSRSKALGEYALLSLRPLLEPAVPDLVIVRATSVQGQDRGTTASLRRVARSSLASVASPGTQPSVASSVAELVRLVRAVGVSSAQIPAIVLQPWEGLSVSDVLSAAGGRAPRRLPAALCRVAVASGNAVGRVVPELAGAVRRVEVMWFGQRQAPTRFSEATEPGSESLVAILHDSGATR